MDTQTEEVLSKIALKTGLSLDDVKTIYAEIPAHGGHVHWPWMVERVRIVDDYDD